MKTPNIGLQRTARLRLAAAEAGSLGGRNVGLLIGDSEMRNQSRFIVVFAAIVGLILGSLACSSNSSQSLPVLSSSKASGVTDEMIGSKSPPMSLTKMATDSSYGYSEKSPVIVGGGFGNGSKHLYSFLNALRGPEGQVVHYRRVGTCCSFKTPNSPFGDSDVLEVYEITYDGLKEPKRLYFDWDDTAEVLVPVGLTARK
jgi:hypothetical protein